MFRRLQIAIAQHFYSLGINYAAGKEGYTKDEKKAARYFEWAAKKKHIEAQFYIGLCYETGTGIQKNEQKAVYYYQFAADQGINDAQLSMGICYEKGIGIQKNEQKAVYYYQLAADQDVGDAQFNLGACYREGIGVQKNDEKSAYYYQLAADKGIDDAQFRIGLCYKKGIGVQKNQQKATYYYQLAANQGHINSQLEMGERYEIGLYVTQDNKKAIKYFELAAERGEQEAQQKLFLRYSIGHGIEKNEKKAAYYHQLATTVAENDAFRLFSSNQELKTNLIKAPSLLLTIFEKTTSNILEKGLYEYIFSPDVNLAKSYVPWNPPFAKTQRGPTCGLNALEMGLLFGYPNRKIPPARKNPIMPTPAEKKKNKNIYSLRKAAKKYGSATGEAYQISILESTAKEFKFNECKVIKVNKKNQEKYSQKIINTIKSGHSIILPVDGNDGFPGMHLGKKTHYALAWAVIHKNNQDYFLVTHYGKHYLWSTEEFKKSHEQIPDMNPLSGEYYKDRETDYYYLTEENQSIPAKNLRTVLPSDLSDFQFKALSIPTPERNFLVLKEKKDIYQAVKSSDAIMLKLLLEADINLKVTSPEEKKSLEDIAKENKDTFSLRILESLKYSTLSNHEQLKITTSKQLEDIETNLTTIKQDIITPHTIDFLLFDRY